MSSRSRVRYARAVTLGYGVFAALWIFVTDRLIGAFTDLGSAVWFSTLKGLLFVLITTAGLFIALRGVPSADETDHAERRPFSEAGARFPAWMGYVFAAALSMGVILLRANLSAAAGTRSLAILFVLPIAVSALWGGVGPGLLATGLTTVAAAWYMAPAGSLAVDAPIDTFQAWLLLTSGLFISVISGSLRRSRRQAIERLEEGRRLAHELRVNEERLRLALASANQGLYDLDVTTGEALVSPEYATMLGYDPATFVESNDRWLERCHPDDRAGVAEEYRRYIEGETAEYRVEFRQRAADGRWKWILSLGSVVERDGQGRPLRMLGTHTDITGRREAENALRDSERRYRDLFESNPHPMFVYDLDTLGFLAVNDAAVQKYGYTRDAFSRMTIKDIRPPEDVPALLENVATAPPETQASGEWRHRARDGREFLVEITSHAITFGGRSARLVLAHDVTARVAAEREVRRLSQAVEHSPASVVITDTDGHIEYVNRKFTETTGYTREEVVGRNPRILKSGETSADEYVNLWATISRGETWQGEFHNRRKNGELYWEYASISPIVDARGAITHYVALKEDITERKHSERALQQSQRMDAIGRLAGGVAHDFNNMLNVILGYADMMMSRLAANDPLREDLTEIQKAAQRSADLTGQLLAFARRQTVEPKVLDLNAVIGDRARMLRRLIGEDIAFTVMPGADLWSICIDPSQLDQVLANLSVNSRDAIGGVGRVTIETRNVAFDTAFCAERPGVTPGEYVQLAFRDTGCGMDRETLSRVFEPFFTTKEPGRGTGLGLATVYGIVKQNGGTIDVESEPGRGTSFLLGFPRHHGPSTGDAEAEDEELPGGTETILVVEDEAQILRLCRQVLERVGYTVLATTSPASAIDQAARHAGPIHLLLTDVIMPGMNGKALQSRIEPLVPGIRTLFMSGYTADVIASRGVLDPGVELLQKPFTPRGLAMRVRSTLDQA